MNPNMASSKHISSGERSEFRFLIPSKVASVIIGKGGERIKRLRAELNARLSIPDNPGPERIFTVEGTLENCVCIWKDCFFECKDFMGNRDPENDELDIRLLYHTTLVGNIIGKGGETIKNLKANYDVSQIKVYPVPAPMSTDRVVQIVGNIDRIFEVVREMVEIMSKQTPKGDMLRYDSGHSDEFSSTEYGGWGSNNGRGGGQRGGISGRGTRGGMGSGRGAPSGPVGLRMRNAPGSGMGGGSMGGGMMHHMGGGRGGATPRWPAPQVGRGGGRFPGAAAPRMDGGTVNYQARPLMGDRKRSDPNGSSGYQGFQNKRPRAPFNNGGPMAGMPLRGAARVRMPKNCLDYLNDKNGEKIWNIMNDSGADITTTVNNNLDNINESILEISGSKDQIEGAQYLLQICVKKFLLNL